VNFADIAFYENLPILFMFAWNAPGKRQIKNYSLALFDTPNKILKYYNKGKKREEYIFPIIKPKVPE
jgi:hypothetical protein